ncbi:unnamed protein product [Hymenolepis diminuta]|uniref:Protein-S-isoprenylcysteine O-methyltransferase n=1 Tax=Hymenolepis diminuta TaxID=6216 RepID=A0A0R3SCR2_HYMDI|nr:unnamed protein product [Hymenolepis diminuta]VUZ41942.1 unnamed protein product [Hymenolepis diminuta]
MFPTALPWPAPTSLVGFLLGILFLFIYHFILLYLIEFFSFTTFIILPILFVLTLYVLTRFVFRRTVDYLLSYVNRGSKLDPDGYQPNLTIAFCLGGVFALGFILSYHAFRDLSHPRIVFPFAIYLALLAFFHWSEFFVATLTSPSRANIDLYLLDHSPEYIGAMVLSFLEYWLEVYFWPTKYTSLMLANIIGLAMAVLGEIIRKAAMLTAADNFNHYIEYTLRKDHRLVRSGIYAFCRHPAYSGWFFWSVGTQILLVNPLCSVLYPIAAYLFFKDRVYTEEQSLIIFFGDDYRAYQREVSTGLPFIQGYIEDD